MRLVLDDQNARFVHDPFTEAQLADRPFLSGEAFLFHSQHRDALPAAPRETYSGQPGFEVSLGTLAGSSTSIAFIDGGNVTSNVVPAPPIPSRIRTRQRIR